MGDLSFFFRRHTRHKRKGCAHLFFFCVVLEKRADMTKGYGQYAHTHSEPNSRYFETQRRKLLAEMEVFAQRNDDTNVSKRLPLFSESLYASDAYAAMDVIRKLPRVQRGNSMDIDKVASQIEANALNERLKPLYGDIDDVASQVELYAELQRMGDDAILALGKVPKRAPPGFQGRQPW